MLQDSGQTESRPMMKLSLSGTERFLSAVGILLSADSGEKLGELLFRLVEWIIAPPTIDLTLEELEGPFIPLAGMILYPPLMKYRQAFFPSLWTIPHIPCSFTHYLSKLVSEIYHPQW